ncbi:MAG: LD-carboxypeptidase [Flavobacteriales bacterium]
MLHIPAHLTPGDGVALAAPARFCTEEHLETACAAIEAAGFVPVVPEGLLARDFQFAGDDRHRAAVLSDVLNRSDVKAVWCMRGGYGSARLLPYIAWPAPEQTPWLVGFSDVTALHCALNRRGVATLHAAVVATSMGDNHPARQAVLDALGQAPAAMHFTADERWPARQPVSGPLVGGNLSVLHSLMGTPYFPELDGAVLFIEDVDEMLYHLDRMLLTFELAGVFDRIAALVVGGMTAMRDNTTAFGFSVDNPFGRTVDGILRERIGQRALPVVTGVRAGHLDDNLPLMLGTAVHIA